MSRVVRQDLHTKIDPMRRAVATDAVFDILQKAVVGVDVAAVGVDVASVGVDVAAVGFEVDAATPMDDDDGDSVLVPQVVAPQLPVSTSSVCHEGDLLGDKPVPVVKSRRGRKGVAAKVDLTVESDCVVIGSTRTMGTRGAKSAMKDSTTTCCCGCGLTTDSVRPCGHCNKLSNGVMNELCEKNYRTCRQCPKTKFSGTFSFVFETERKHFAMPDVMEPHRLLEPSEDDQVTFERLVRCIIPTPLRGLNKTQTLATIESYAAEERGREGVSSQTLLERTLEDSSTVVTVNVTRADLRTLRYLITSSGAVISWWLNDVVINGYLELINSKLMINDQRVHCFNSFFLDKFRTLGYKDVERWSAAVRRQHSVKSIFEMERLIVPVNIGNYHWTFLVVHMRERAIVYYDSSPSGDISTANAWMESMLT